jgi:NAD(P)-dependent dehydrogenase (short-subunit alcohol dehydrogenase family)
VTLREGLLEGRRIAVGGDHGGVEGRLRDLGGWVTQLEGELVLDEQAAERIGELAPLDGLVYAAATAFGAGGPAGLGASLRLAWLASRAVATGALIPGDAAGKVVLITPRAGAGPHVQAAREGLVNLARTLSVEWARFGVTAVAITPGARTGDDELAELVCFLVSPAGEYFSGCAFELGADSLIRSS